MSVTKVSSISFPSRLTRWNWAKGGSGFVDQDVTSTDVQVLTAVRTRTGQRLGKWRQVIRNGGNATTPLTATYDSFYSNPIDAYLEFIHLGVGRRFKRRMQGDLVYATSGPNARMLTFLDPTVGELVADNRARARFYKRLREIQVQFSGPTFLGELRETLRMIKRPAAAIRDTLDNYSRDLKRAKKGSGKKWKNRDYIQQVASGLWLEHTFGWMPLLNDVQSAVEAYERLTPPLRSRKVISVGDTDAIDRYKGLASNPLWNTFGSQNVQNGTFYITKRLRKAIDSVSVRYKGAVNLECEATRWDNLALFGFTPSEFIPTAWELLPWSFLIDYFTNIGDVLTASVTNTTNVAYVNKTVRHTVTVEGDCTPDLLDTMNKAGSGMTWVSGSTNVGYYVMQRKTVARSAGSAVPLPRLQLESGLSVGQMCNITALLMQFNQSLHHQNPPRRNYRR